MSRATRVEFPGAIYHAMGRAMGGVKAFTEDEHRERFFESIGQKAEFGDPRIEGPVVARKMRAITASLLKGRRGQA